ncbi:MAG: hypothetical protein Cons2KO_15630 [Congregibacter sp.]
MKAILTATVLSLSCASAGAQTIYKCVDEQGRKTFSQSPCSEDAEKITVKNDNAGLSVGPKGDFSKMRDSNAIREMNRKIDALNADVDTLRLQREGELAVLREKKTYAANNLAGATWLQSLSGEMQAVTDSYNSQIESKRDEIKTMRQEIRDIMNRDFIRSSDDPKENAKQQLQ